MNELGRYTNTIADLEDTLRARCGKDLITLFESYREQAHADFESATNDEERLRAQALSVVFRDMAEKFRGETEQAIIAALVSDKLMQDSQ